MPFTNKKQFLLLKLLPFICIFSQNVLAKEFTVTPSDNLQKMLDASQNGDTLTLTPGQYFGNFVIDKQITLRGSRKGKKKGSIIDAQGIGHALVLKNAHITIDNLAIVNWGHDLTEQSSGIYSQEKVNNKKAEGIVISNNALSGDGFGISLNYATKAKVFNNTVEGNLSLRSAERGNGIQVANVSHSHVFNNEILNTRDGIYVISSQNNLIDNNIMHDLRYGIHYMYSFDDTVKDNTAYSNRAGYALMSSKQLTIIGNKATDNDYYGFLLNFLTESTFTNNHVKKVGAKPENKVFGRVGKGFFIYNSSNNTLKNNIIDTAEIGIHLTAGSESIKVFENSFINNPTQVKYVSNKKQEWSKDGRGNYWGNYLGWDMNNDGIGDAVFEPNDGIDKLVWQYPEMKMIMDSPTILILRWVQKQFPVLKPPSVKDSHPLMTPHFSQENIKRKQHALANALKSAPLQEEKL